MFTGYLLGQFAVLHQCFTLGIGFQSGYHHKIKTLSTVGSQLVNQGRHAAIPAQNQHRLRSLISSPQARIDYPAALPCTRWLIALLSWISVFVLSGQHDQLVAQLHCFAGRCVQVCSPYITLLSNQPTKHCARAIGCDLRQCLTYTDVCRAQVDLVAIVNRHDLAIKLGKAWM